MSSMYPKFVCSECDIELHCLVNPETCTKCGGMLLIEDDDEPDPDIPLGLYYWSQNQKERALEASIKKGIRQFEQLLGADHGSQDQEENLS